MMVLNDVRYLPITQCRDCPKCHQAYGRFICIDTEWEFNDDTIIDEHCRLEKGLIKS